MVSLNSRVCTRSSNPCNCTFDIGTGSGFMGCGVETLNIRFNLSLGFG